MTPAAHRTRKFISDWMAVRGIALVQILAEPLTLSYLLMLAYTDEDDEDDGVRVRGCVRVTTSFLESFDTGKALDSPLYADLIFQPLVDRFRQESLPHPAYIRDYPN